MRKYKPPKYKAPSWVIKALESLRPVERVPTSKWAENSRILGDNCAMPGKWRNNVTPYLVDIMDEFSNGDAERIIFVKPTQVGGTAAMENMIGSMIDQDPGPTMVVYPSDDLAKQTVETKLEPMIQSCPTLAKKYKEHESTDLKLVFQGLTIYLTGANSPADLASKAIKNLFLDEVDKFQGASKKESDPISLAIERTKTFVATRKIFITSTPTLKTGHIWRQLLDAIAERHYFVPCPHCGAYIELKFAQIRWPSKEDVPEREKRVRQPFMCARNVAPLSPTVKNRKCYGMATGGP